MLDTAGAVLDVLARAGGGQNGGGSSGGSGGGGFGGGLLFGSLLGGGGIGVLILVAVGYAVFRAMSSRGGGSGTGDAGGLGDGSGYGGGGGGTATIPPPSSAAAGGVPTDASQASVWAGGAAPASAQGFDDSHPIGVPEKFRGAMLQGSDPAALGGGVAEGIAAITAHDPAFDADAFLTQAQTAFFTIQQAWMQAKPELSRSVMADGLAQQHAIQIDEYVRKGQRNLLDGLNIQHAGVVSAHSDASFDTITVRIDAASADYDVDAKSGNRVRGHTDIEPWSENWVFQRSSQTTTKPGQGTMNRHCPNCQAPISITAQGECEYCKAPVMSGKYDWVLARIDQL